MPDSLAALAARLRRIDAVRAVATRIEEAAVADVRRRMEAGLQPDGTPQPPVKPRPGRGFGPPLIDRGDLRDSVTAEVVGTTLRMAASGPGAGRHQAERPFLGMSPALEAEIAALVASQVAETLTQ